MEKLFIFIWLCMVAALAFFVFLPVIWVGDEMEKNMRESEDLY